MGRSVAVLEELEILWSCLQKYSAAIVSHGGASSSACIRGIVRGIEAGGEDW